MCATWQRRKQSLRKAPECRQRCVALFTLEADPHVAACLRYSDWVVWKEVVEALGRMGETAVPSVNAGLKDSDWVVRKEAVEALSGMGSSEAVIAQLRQTSAQEVDWRVRDAAQSALRALGATERQGQTDHRGAAASSNRSGGLRAQRAEAAGQSLPRSPRYNAR